MLRAAQAKRSKKGVIAGAAALLALCAGGAAWLALDNTKPAALDAAARQADAHVMVPAGPSDSPLASADSAAAPAAVAPAQVAASESEVSAAAILGHGTPPPAPAAASLKDMLDAPSVAKADGDELDKLLAGSASPMPAELKGDSPAPAKPARREPAAASKESGKKAVATAKPAPAKVAIAPKAAPAKAAPGDDASLLAALVAHSKEGGGGAASNAGSAPTSLRQCRQLNAAQAEQCRVRLCADSAKDDPQCKSLRSAKPATE